MSAKRRWMWAVVVGLVAVSILSVLLVLRARYRDPREKIHTDSSTENFVRVAPGLYRGERPDRVDVGRLAKLGVRTIIDLEDIREVVDRERGWAQTAGIDFVSAPMSGISHPKDTQIDELLRRLRDAKASPVFVHCKQGQDRTGIVIALHRVINEGWAPQAAHDEMMRFRFNSLLDDLDDYFDKKVGLHH